MNTDDEGLKLVKTIREDLKNKMVRIVLRTGQPGLAAEKTIISEYDINFYLSKQDQTVGQLENTLMMCLRDYHNICLLSDQMMSLSVAGSIAHEMRNPLSAVYQCISLVREHLFQGDYAGETKQKIDDLLELSTRSIDRGQMIISLILRTVKGQSPDPKTFSNHSIETCIQNAISEYAFKDKELEKISVNIVQNFTFWGDIDAMVFVLFNLMKNALYYMNNYPESRITLTTKSGHSANHLFFKDTGPGISEENLENIFDSFVSFGKKEGTGLGLPFCKRVLTSIKGDIFCRSKLGEYTEFELVFPKVDSRDDNKEESSHTVEVSVTSDLVQDFSKYRALVVDDDSMSSTILATRLKKFGLKADQVTSGAECLLALDKNTYDMIFMDIEMPEMDGFETTKKIRSGETFSHFKQYKNIPIMTVSGHDLKLIQKQANDVGVTHCIMKPISKRNLIEILELLK